MVLNQGAVGCEPLTPTRRMMLEMTPVILDDGEDDS